MKNYTPEVRNVGLIRLYAIVTRMALMRIGRENQPAGDGRVPGAAGHLLPERPAAVGHGDFLVEVFPFAVGCPTVDRDGVGGGR